MKKNVKKSYSTDRTTLGGRINIAMQGASKTPTDIARVLNVSLADVES